MTSAPVVEAEGVHVGLDAGENGRRRGGRIGRLVVAGVSLEMDTVQLSLGHPIKKPANT
jgi:hypothetical protein